MADNTQTRNRLLMRWTQLKTERSSWWPLWQSLSRFLLPWNGRFFRQDRNLGGAKYNEIYANVGIRAVRTLGAGMMSGATSPARPWFRLGTHDDDLNDFQPVKVWLSQVSKRMHSVFAKSNTYRALQQIYEELAVFGTGASIILPSFSSVIHHYPVTTGEYAIATDAQGRVTTLYREFEMTVSQLVREFGRENCSTTVQNSYDNGTLDTWFPIIHAIEPRYDRDPSKKDSRNMAWASYYFEIGSQENKFLRESGFPQFPAVVPRWAVAGGDVYGNSPGMEALGDTKQLQIQQLRKGQTIDYQTNPPLQVPTFMKNREVDMMPGGITFLDGMGPGTKIETLWDVKFDMQYLLQDLENVEERIKTSFFTDIFLMFEGQEGEMTATEVAARQGEKMLLLGPVLERLNNELLYPMVETTFLHMVERGALPPAPQELAGQDLAVEFVSVLAQAQRAVGTNAIDRFVGSLGAVAAIKPDVLDKFDSDEWADLYSDMLGVDPQLVIPNDQVMLVRQQRAKAQAAQAAAATAEQAGGAAANFAKAAAVTPQATGGPGSDVLNMFSGYQSPSGTEVVH